MKNLINAQRLRNAQNGLNKILAAVRCKVDNEIMDLMEDVWRDMDIVATDLEIEGDK